MPTPSEPEYVPGTCAHCGAPAEMCIDCGVPIHVFEAERARAEEIIRGLLEWPWPPNRSETAAAVSAARAWLGIEP